MITKLVTIAVAAFGSILIAGDSPVAKPICCMKNAYCCSTHRSCCPKTSATNKVTLKATRATSMTDNL